MKAVHCFIIEEHAVIYTFIVQLKKENKHNKIVELHLFYL
jgi:hypothetical protein